MLALQIEMRPPFCAFALGVVILYIYLYYIIDLILRIICSFPYFLRKAVNAYFSYIWFQCPRCCRGFSIFRNRSWFTGEKHVKIFCAAETTHVCLPVFFLLYPLSNVSFLIGTHLGIELRNFKLIEETS